MKITCRFRILVFLVTIVSFASCKKDEVTPELTVTPLKFSLDAEGDTAEFTVTSNDSWTISNPGLTWLQLSQVGGNSGEAVVKITASENATGSTRSVILNVSADTVRPGALLFRRQRSFFQPTTHLPSHLT